MCVAYGNMGCGVSISGLLIQTDFFVKKKFQKKIIYMLKCMKEIMKFELSIANFVSLNMKAFRIKNKIQFPH